MRPFALGAAAFFVALGAHADGPAIVAVNSPDPALYEALRVALEPWDVEVRRLGRGGTRDEDAGEELARDIGGDGVVSAAVVVFGDGDEMSVGVYVASTEHWTVREVAWQEPLSPGHAAAMALTVKTILRASPLAPRRERVVDEPEPEPWAVRAAVHGGAGVHGAGGVEARVGATVTVVAHRLAGVIALGEIGTGVAVRSDRVDATSTMGTVGGGARLVLFDSRHLAVDLDLGLVLHVVSLDGTALAMGEVVRSRELNGGAFGALGLRWTPAELFDVAFGVRVDVPWIRQRYLVDGEPVRPHNQFVLVPFASLGMGGG